MAHNRGGNGRNHKAKRRNWTQNCSNGHGSGKSSGTVKKSGKK